MLIIISIDLCRQFVVLNQIRTVVTKCLCSLQYGFINSCLQSLVMERFGEETWDKLRFGRIHIF